MTETATAHLPAEKPATELKAVPPKAGGDVRAIVPQNLEEVKYIAGLIISAGLAPSSYNNDHRKIALGIMKGAEVGLPPITALSSIAIVNGRPTIWGDGAIALVLANRQLSKIAEFELGAGPGEGGGLDCFGDDYGFEVQMWRTGVDGPFIGRFTVGDAKRAKLWANPKRGPWMQYPKRMLRMRAVGFAIRNGFADCLAGMMVREEVEDLPPAAAPPANTDFLDGDAPGAVVEDVPTVDVNEDDSKFETDIQWLHNCRDADTLESAWNTVKISHRDAPIADQQALNAAYLRRKKEMGE